MKWGYLISARSQYSTNFYKGIRVIIKQKLIDRKNRLMIMGHFCLNK